MVSETKEDKMDPNETLRVIRERYNSLLADPDGFSLADAHELSEHIKSLDEWILKGGFLPSEWSKAY